MFATFLVLKSVTRISAVSTFLKAMIEAGLRAGLIVSSVMFLIVTPYAYSMSRKLVSVETLSKRMFSTVRVVE